MCIRDSLESGAKMVDFAGWDMPIHYGSQLQEHHQVRNDAGMFDGSHMVILDLVGAQSKALLQYLLANNVDKLKESGKALYSCMLTLSLIHISISNSFQPHAGCKQAAPARVNKVPSVVAFVPA